MRHLGFFVQQSRLGFGGVGFGGVGFARLWRSSATPVLCANHSGRWHHLESSQTGA
jgi:hypothetical protein